MYACLDCGKRLPPRAKGGHREREYCSDACRQNSRRKRKKQEQEIERLIEGQYLYTIPNADPHVTRDRWLSERESLLQHCKQVEAQRNTAEAEAAYLKSRKSMLEESVRTLEDVLAEKEAEIIRLTVLLESQSQRRRR